MAASVAAVVGTEATTSPAHAESTDGALTVRVIRDMGANGTWDPVIDLTLAGVQVTITDESGASVKLTTDADGEVTLPAGDTRLAGGKYRVDVANPDSSYYAPAFASAGDPATTPSATDLSPNEEFVDVSNGASVTVTTGFWHAHDYCQSNPKVANACQPGMFNAGDPNNVTTSARDTLFLTDYNDSDYESIAKSAADPATGVGTGSVFGVAYNRLTKQIFSAAYAKRNVAYGDAGPGGVYITDPTTKVTKVFTVVPDAGTTAHETTTTANGGHEDLDFRKVVGKESLGAIVMSDDDKSLFVMNLNDKTVYDYDATGDSATSATSTIDVSTSPCPAGTTANDWRPSGLGENDGTLYVGGVCTGEDEATDMTNNRPATMRAIVLAYDESTGASKGVVLDQPLSTYLRAQAGASFSCATGVSNAYSPWLAWNDDMWCSGAGQNAPAQPMLSKILVEANGDLDLDFRDRDADQNGVNLYAMTVGNPNPTRQQVITAGALDRACLDTTTDMYVMDVNGGCGITSPDANGVGVPFYNQQGATPHGNPVFAGMTRSRAEQGLISDQMDAGGPVNQNGLTVFSNETGADLASQTVVQANGPTMNGFVKGAGLADMDVLCNLAPIQIGNRVWYNDAGDGTQNAAEKPVAGATVNLYDKSGNLVASTKTNDQGEYYFDSLTTTGLDYNTDYVVKMDNPDDYKAGGPLDSAKWGVTKLGSGDDGNKATAGADGYPQIPLTTGNPGADVQTYDFGFTPKPAIHIVKYDGRLAGPTGGPLVHDGNPSSPTVYQAGANGTTGAQPVTMIVTNTGTAALGNVAVTDRTLQAPAMTGLTCDFSALGGPRSGTTWGGVFQPGDSFPCTGSIDLTAGDVHADQASVSAVQVDPITGRPTTGAPTVSDADSYYAKTGYESKIVITKRDKKSGDEADTKHQAMKFKPGKARKIDMPATNVGTSPISQVVISDKDLRGPAVKNLRCTFPDGTKVKANKKGVVRWAASFGANPHTWNPGVTFHCTAKLKLAAGAKLHGDRVKVQGVDPAGHHLASKNRFYAKVRKPLPGVPNTGA
jgi:hypothetical protein